MTDPDNSGIFNLNKKTMNVAKFKELIAGFPDEMPVELLKIEGDDEEERTIPIIEVGTQVVENDEGEQIEILVIAF